MNVTLHIDGKPIVLENVTRGRGEVSFMLGSKAYVFRGHRLPDGSCMLERQVKGEAWQRMHSALWQVKSVRHVQLGALEATLSEGTAVAAAAEAKAALSPRAPMPGVVRQILVKAGEHVEEGQALVVMEAMKLQTTLSAGGAARVEAILVREGELIAEGAELVKLAALKAGKGK